MSRNVDERIVEMQFDNKQFESGIRTSIKSLANLKESLNMDAAAKSLSKIEKACNGFSLSKMGESVDFIASKFTNLGIVGTTALVRIANAAITQGAKIVKGLSLEPVLTGFEEYETKMNAITTILTNTKSKGTTLDDVNKALNELNKYADLTIYNFAEMTKNIGTFTAAGVDLDTSVNAIKGIANLAAGSGSTPAQAANAMYQLSQALAAGRVSLQDWNSVVNAGMGGELFQNALKETAKQMGIVVDESVSFRDSISSVGGKSSWLTSDVLVKTLEKFANDPSLIKAATQVKTLTQLIDTMKESVQSGWAQSWEYIIGDSEQAATLFTNISDAFNSIITPSTNARNAMLQFWNANGGRDKVIQGLANVIKTLGSVLKPIGEAFNEAFPPMTGERLVSLSNSFFELTKRFTVGERTIKNIKDTFKGLFSVVQLVGKAASSIIKPIFGLTGSVGSLGSAVFEITGAFGRFLTKLNESKGINEIFDTITQSLTKAIKSINNFSSSAFKNTGTVMTYLEKFGSGVVKVLDTAASSLGKVIKWISENISLGDVFAGLAGGGIFVAAKKLSGIFDTIKETLEGFFGSGEKIKDSVGTLSDILSSLHDSLTSFTTGIRVASIVSIAIAIGILSASLNTISKIKATSVAKSLLAIGVMLTELDLAFRSILKTLKKFNSKGLLSASLSIIAIATSISILAGAIKEIGKLKLGDIEKGLLGVGVALGELSAFVKLTDFKKISVKGSLGLIAMAKAISIIADALSKFSGMSWNDLEKGLIGVSIGLADLVAAVKIINKTKISISTSVAILALAEACSILADAMKEFSGLSWGTIQRGLTAMGVALGEISLAIGLLGKFSGGKSLLASGGILITVQSFSDIIDFLKEVSTLNWTSIEKGLTAMGGALGELTVSLSILSKVGGFSSLFAAGSILITVQGLKPISDALKEIGGLSWKEIQKGLTGMGAALLELTVVLGALGKLSPFGSLLASGSILLAVQSLKPISDTLKEVGALSWKEIQKGLTGMGGALGELVIVLGILGKVSPFGSLLASGSILLAVQSLKPISDALKEIGGLSWKDIRNGLVGMGGALAELAVITGLLGSLAPLGGLLGSGSILIGVQGLDQLADALKKFGTMDWDTIGHGMAAMAGALGSLALGSVLNTLSLLGSISIANVAEPLGVLADSVSKWKNVTIPKELPSQLGQLARGILSFSLGGIGAGALSSSAPGIEAMAGAISKWKTVTIPEGLEKGLKSIANGVKSFTWAFVGGFSIDGINKPLGNLATTVKKWNGVTIPEGIESGLKKLANGVKSFTWAFVGGYSIDVISGPLKNLAGAVTKWNGVTIPEGVGPGLKQLASGIKAFEGIESSGINFTTINNGLTTLATASHSLENINFPVIVNGLNSFASAAKGLPNEIGNLAMSLKQSLSNAAAAIQSQGGAMNGAFATVITSCITTIHSYSGRFTSAGKETANAFINSLVNSIFSKTASASNAMKKMLESTINTSLNYIKSSKSKFQNEAKNLIDAFINGAKSKKGSVTSAFRIIVSSASSGIEGYESKFNGVGRDMIQGLINGIYSKKSGAINAAADVASAALRAAKKALDSNSPSKKFITLGEDSDEGLIIGFLNRAKQVAKSSSGVVETALYAAKSTLSKLPAILSEDISLSPRITPVVDLSNVYSGNSAIGSMLSKTRTIRTTYDTNELSRTASAVSSIERSRNNYDVSNALYNLNKRIDRLESNRTANSEATTKQPIVLETHVDVGGREVAKATAVYMKEEMEKVESSNKRMGGYR